MTLIVIIISSAVCVCVAQMHDEHGEQHRHFEHDPRVPLRTIKCLECYETTLTKGSACSRTRYCEGKWCVKGPDSGGVYRGCMQILPFNTQTARCYNITGEDGKVNENCYCNSGDFCNSTTQLNSATTLLISSLLTLFIFRR